MSLYTIRPLGPWPDSTPAAKRSAPKFTSTWTQTVTLLERELGELRAKDVVLQVDYRDRDLRLDGQLRADARLGDHPGVRLIFDSKHGPLTYATDQFTSGRVWAAGNRSVDVLGWQANARAIALGLEALRAVDRYGIASRGEQYAGYRAIEAGTGARAMGGMTRDDAQGVVLRAGGIDGATAQKLGERFDWARAYRSAQAATHPDAGGDRSQWDLVEVAGRVLGLAS